VNYGLDKVRFTSPVKVGSKVRMQASITEVTEVKGGAQIKVAEFLAASTGKPFRGGAATGSPPVAAPIPERIRTQVRRPTHPPFRLSLR
jgi:acyl dehydratase